MSSMLPFETIVAFAGAAILLSFVPGPDNLFVLIQSALFGRLVGVFVTLGLCAGLLVHTVAVSLGVAAIFQTSQLAFDVLKTVGAIYLVYLAFKSFRAKPQPLEVGEEGKRPMAQMFVRGIVMNVTNPKVAIFFLAFLPQFTSSARGSIVLQMLALGGVFIVCAFLSFLLISFLAGSISSWLRRSATGQVILNRVASIVFIGLAAKLITSHH